MNAKRIIAMVLAIILAFGALSGCSSSNSSQNASSAVSTNSNTTAETTNDAAGRTLPGGLFVPEGKTTSITIQMDADIESLNPWAVRSTSVALFQRNVYERLFDYNNDQEIVPFMVKAYEWDGELLKCEIYDDIYDIEGNHFTTSDIIFSFQKAAESGAYVSNSKAVDLEKTIVEDDYHITFAFANKPSVLTLDNLTGVCMVTEAGYNASPDGLITTACGTGTYTVENYTAGAELVLVPNNNYWMSDADVEAGGTRYNQNVDKIIYKIIPDGTQRTIEFDSKTVDVLYSCPASAFLNYRDDSSVDTFETINSQTYFCRFNADRESPMQDARVRLAVAYAIDNDTINKGVYENMVVTADQVQSKFVVEYVEGMVGTGYEYNVEKAKELLKEAGYENGLEITLIYSGAFSTLGEVIQNQLAKAGVTVVMKEIEDAEMQSFLEGDTSWDMMIGKTVQKCGTVLFMLNSNVGPQSRISKYVNEEYSQLLEEALSTGDVDIARQAAQIAMDDCAVYTIAYDVNWHVNRPGIQNPTTCSECVFPGNWEYTEAATWLIDD